MDAVKLSAGYGWLWIRQGNYLFKKSSILLIVLTFITIAALIAISTIPMIGEPAVALLFPLLFSGLLLGCQALENDEELELPHLFAGFQQNAPQLITLGGFNYIAQLSIFWVMKVTGGAALVAILMSNTPVEDPAIIQQALAGAGFSIFLGTTLFAILLMATQFAPMLVTFNKIAPLQALRLSLRACLRNLVPLSVYGAVMLTFAIAASLPMMLGWLILLPIMITSIYAAYRGIFPTEEERLAEMQAESPSQNDE